MKVRKVLVKSCSTLFPVLLNKVNHSGSIEKGFVSSGRKFSLEKLEWLCLIRDLSHTDKGYPCLFDLPRFVIRGRSGMDNDCECVVSALSIENMEKYVVMRILKIIFA